MTRKQKAILGILFVLVIVVFALATYMSFSQYLSSEALDFEQTMAAIDYQTRATFTAVGNG